MPTKPRYFQAGSFYHVYNRGNRKQNIFLSEKDYSRFLTRMKEYKKESGLKIISYCLMPNHFHLIARLDTDDSLTSFMSKLSTSHSKYINAKYEFVGSLFQGRFKAILIDNENYFKHLIRYVHINPLSLGWSAKRLHLYRWSSYRSYLDLSDSLLVDMKIVEDLVSVENHRDFVESYVAKPVQNHVVFGSEDYYIDFVPGN